MYSYKLFNTDSLNNIRPVGDSAKTNLLNAQAVIGLFEKNINGRDSILVEGGGRGYLKDVKIEISDADANTAGRGVETLSFPSNDGCSYTMIVTETYIFIDTYYNGVLTDTQVFYTSQVAVSVICATSDPAPGSGGGSGSGGSGGWYWYNYGTGSYYNANQPTNGQYWWTNALGGGVGDAPVYSSQVQYLMTTLSSMNQNQINFLQTNQEYAQTLYNLLSSTADIDEVVEASAMINIEVARQGLLQTWDEQLFKIILDTYLPPTLSLYKNLIYPHIVLQYTIEAENDPLLAQEASTGNFLAKSAARAKLLFRATDDLLHIALDIGGLMPVVGEIFDLTNAGLYLVQGDGFNATLSATSAIPIAGWFSTGIKIAKKTISVSKGKTTLKWLVQNDGFINFGNRGQ